MKKWRQYYFWNNHLHENNCAIVIKLFLEQKSAKPSDIKFVPLTWFNKKDIIFKVCTELVFHYCPYFAWWLWLWDVKKTQKSEENPTKVRRYLLDIHYYLIWYNRIGKSDSIFITSYSRAESYLLLTFVKTNFPKLIFLIWTILKPINLLGN